MRLARSLAVIAIVCLLSAGAHGQGWKLVWEDEFNGRRNAPPDAKNWTAEVGGQVGGTKSSSTTSLDQKRPISTAKDISSSRPIRDDCRRSSNAGMARVNTFRRA